MYTHTHGHAAVDGPSLMKPGEIYVKRFAQDFLGRTYIFVLGAVSEAVSDFVFLMSL